MLAVEPDYIDLILADNGAPPEERFVAVMDLVMNALQDSPNVTLARVGASLRKFWDNDMANTHMWTPPQAGAGDGTSG